MTNTPFSIERRRLSLHTNKVSEVLPEYFTSQYPDLISFLEKYYQFLDSDSSIDFDQQLKSLFGVRDLHSTSLENIDKILKEIGLGLANTTYFQDPVFSTRLLSSFHRVKGSLYSAEAFFKAFYGIDAEISYPKRNIFIVGESLIGAESLRFLQDGALYQILSILIKSELPSSVWRELFKDFAHPAGFYLGSEVVITGLADNLATVINNMPTAIPDVRSPVYQDVAINTIVGDIDITEIVRSDSSGVFVEYSPYHSMQPYSIITIGQLDDMYQSAKDIISIAPFTFDEDDDSNGNAMDMSNIIQTFDQSKTTWYDSDSG